MKMSKTLFFFALLALTSLACGLPSLPRAEEVIPPDAAATAAAASQQAAQAAATAAAFAGDQGESLIATVQASNMVINLDLSALGEKFANLQPDANGNVVIVLTDDEINQVLQGQNTITQQGVAIDGLRVMFTGGNVLLTGGLVEPLQAQLTASFSPVVIDGQLEFQLVSATLGRFPVPAGILNSIEPTLNNSIGTLLNNLPQEFILQSVAMGEGTMTIVIRRV